MRCARTSGNVIPFSDSAALHTFLSNFYFKFLTQDRKRSKQLLIFLQFASASSVYTLGISKVLIYLVYIIITFPCSSLPLPSTEEPSLTVFVFVFLLLSLLGLHPA